MEERLPGSVLPSIEDILGSDVPPTSIPSLSGQEIRPLELCRVLTRNPETHDLIVSRARYLGTCDGSAIFMDMDDGCPLVVPEERIQNRAVGFLPEPQLQNGGEETKPQIILSGETNKQQSPTNPELDWEKIAQFWTTPLDDADPLPSW